jgi:hypothetical protein
VLQGAQVVHQGKCFNAATINPGTYNGSSVLEVFKETVSIADKDTSMFGGKLTKASRVS